MDRTTLHVKNMVCSRCIKVVKEDMNKLGLEVENIQLGQVTIKNSHGEINIDAVKDILLSEGFEILEDKNALLKEEIKTAIINLIYSGKIEDLHIKLSDYLANHLNKDYHFLSTVFSTLENSTIEKYYILLKIERAKELLSYNELSLGEISRKLGYSNISHFSNQFRRITGEAPTHYRKDTVSKRKFIDQVN